MKPKKNQKELDLISDRGLMDIYSKYKTIKLKNSEKVNDFIEEININSKQELKKLLLLQEKSLKKNEDNIKYRDNITKFIANKTKKTEDELLMNRTDGFRMKQELKTMMDFKKPAHERYGVNSWMISLRRPENFEGTRYAFVNVGTNFNPTWARIKEKVPDTQHFEKIRMPESHSYKDIKNLKKFPNFYKTFSNFHINIDNIDKLDKMTVYILNIYNVFR
jgi:hypothetical protein